MLKEQISSIKQSLKWLIKKINISIGKIISRPINAIIYARYNIFDSSDLMLAIAHKDKKISRNTILKIVKKIKHNEYANKIDVLNKALFEYINKEDTDIDIIGYLVDAGANPFGNSVLEKVFDRKDRKEAYNNVLIEILKKTKDHNYINKTDELNKLLFRVFKKNDLSDIDIIGYLMDAGADPFALHGDFSFIELAINFNDKAVMHDVILKILDKIKDHDYANKTYQLNKLLFMSINKDDPDTDIIKHIIRQGANPNIQNDYGNAALVIAIENDDAELFSEVVKNPKTNLLVVANNGNTPLMLAREYKNNNIIKQIEEDSRFDHNEKQSLLNQGVILEKIRSYLLLNKRDNDFIEQFIIGYCNGISCLYIYCKAIQTEEKPKNILKNDYDWFVNTIRLISTFDTRVPLTKKEIYCFEVFISNIEYLQNSFIYSKGVVSQIKALQSLQDVLSEKENSYRTLFEEPTVICKTVSFSELESYLNSIKENEFTLVHANRHATVFIKKEGCYYLFDSNSKYGEKVLISAEKLARALFDSHSYYSDEKQNNFKFITQSFKPVVKPTANAFEPKVQQELQKNQDINKKISIDQAIECGDLNNVRYILSDLSSQDIKNINNIGKIAKLAVEKGNLGIVRELIDKGIEFDNTTAILAAERGNIEIFKEILGDKRDVASQHGETAFFVAVRCKRLDIIKLLLKTNIDPNVKSGVGMTALMLAIKYHNRAENKDDKNKFIGIIKELKENLKADINVRYRNIMLDVVSEYTARKNSGENLFLEESRLDYFMDACGKITKDYDEVFSAIKSINNDPFDVIRLIRQDVVSFKFEKLRKLNKINQTSFVELLKYGFTPYEGENAAKEKAELISKILEIDYLFDTKNNNDQCITKILCVVIMSMKQGDFVCKDRALYELKELKSKLQGVIEEYKNHNIISALSNIIDQFVTDECQINKKYNY